MTMQQQTQAQPIGPTVYQIYTYTSGILNARNPKRAEVILRDVANTWADRVKAKLEHMQEASGFREGPPEFRREAYTWKSQQEATLGLWAAEMQEYPDHFDHDVVDAYKLGALLPPWCELEAIRLGARVK